MWIREGQVLGETLETKQLTLLIRAEEHILTFVVVQERPAQCKSMIAYTQALCYNEMFRR